MVIILVKTQIIQIIKILMAKQWQCYQQKEDLFQNKNGIMILIYKMVLITLLRCVQQNIVKEFQMSIGIIIQIYKTKIKIMSPCYQLKIILCLHNNGDLVSLYRIKMVKLLQYYQLVMELYQIIIIIIIHVLLVMIK